MRFPLSLTHQTPLVKAIQFDVSVADIANRWKPYVKTMMTIFEVQFVMADISTASKIT